MLGLSNFAMSLPHEDKTSSRVFLCVDETSICVFLVCGRKVLAIQSGFRKSHSTETLLLRLLSDVLGAVDHCQLTLLALLDVSAAFDTVDHEILLQRLHLSFGVSGTLLSRLTSFVSERSVCVVHGLSRSSWVLGPGPLWSPPRVCSGPPSIHNLHF